MRKLGVFFTSWALLLLTRSFSVAANNPPSTIDTTATTTTTNHLDGITATTKLTFVLWVTLAIVGFGILVLGGITAAFWRSLGSRADEFVRIFAISLVVVASLILIVAGYADSQIAPAFGLFGTIIGYLFGKVDSPKPATPAPTGGTAATGAATTPP